MCSRTQKVAISVSQAKLLLLLSRGHTITSAAQQLGIATGTARNQVRLAKECTGAKSTYQLVVMAAFADFFRKNDSKPVKVKKEQVPQLFTQTNAIQLKQDVPISDHC